MGNFFGIFKGNSLDFLREFLRNVHGIFWNFYGKLFEIRSENSSAFTRKVLQNFDGKLIGIFDVFTNLFEIFKGNYLEFWWEVLRIAYGILFRNSNC